MCIIYAEYNMIFIDPDRTPAEREVHRNLRIELKRRREKGEDCMIRKEKITKRLKSLAAKGTSTPQKIPTTSKRDVPTEQTIQKPRMHTTSKVDDPTEQMTQNPRMPTTTEEEDVLTEQMTQNPNYESRNRSQSHPQQPNSIQEEATTNTEQQIEEAEDDKQPALI